MKSESTIRKALKDLKDFDRKRGKIDPMKFFRMGQMSALRYVISDGELVPKRNAEIMESTYEAGKKSDVRTKKPSAADGKGE